LVVNKVYFDRAGLCEALLSWHSNHAPVAFSAIARSELIAAFAGLTRIGIKVGTVIKTIRLRVGRSLGVRLSGVRHDRHQTQRKAGNYAHSGLLHVVDIGHYSDAHTERHPEGGARDHGQPRKRAAVARSPTPGPG
jgi:hypothetical protein